MVVLTGNKAREGSSAQLRGVYLTYAVVHYGVQAHAELVRQAMEEQSDLWDVATQEYASLSTLDAAWRGILAKAEAVDASLVLPDVKAAVTLQAADHRVAVRGSRSRVAPRSVSMTLPHFCAVYHELVVTSVCEDRCPGTGCCVKLREAMLRSLGDAAWGMRFSDSASSARDLLQLRGAASQAMSLLFSLYTVLLVGELVESKVLCKHAREMLERCGARLCRVVDTEEEDAWTVVA
ncbi:hypothetical protein PWT90_11204 [Aphanocladium album]|nr:hypothetical protein PWT90_11204 [Aphanocladium album]